jgi:cation transport ATPase
MGDGMNDAAADVNVALPSRSNVAINSTSFILLNSDLQTLLEPVILVCGCILPAWA